VGLLTTITVQPGHVDVGVHDVTTRYDLLGQPGGNAGATGAHLPASPALGDAQVGDMAEGRGVEQRRQGVETNSRLGLLVVEQVAVISRHAPSWPGTGDTARAPASPEPSHMGPVRQVAWRRSQTLPVSTP